MENGGDYLERRRVKEEARGVEYDQSISTICMKIE
jgi:hypothetical protein